MLWRIIRLKDIWLYRNNNITPFNFKYQNKIKLSMSLTDIHKFVELEHLDVGYWNYELERLIYLKRLKNTPEQIKVYLRRIHYENIEHFPKMFWEEYVYRFREHFNYNEFKEHIKYLTKIKKVLDKNIEYQGLTGQQLQYICQYKLNGIKGELNYTWRSWGSLMSAYMNSKLKERKFHYMNFYMR